MEEAKTQKKFPAGEGLACPQCACKHLITVNTYPWTQGRKMRRRKCRSCGYIIETVEEVILS